MIHFRDRNGAMKNTLFSLLMFVSSTTFAVDLTQIEKDLGGPGVLGWIHGAVQERDIYVFTYRNPENFFDNIQMSLVTDQPDLIAQLSKLDRHDQVRIKGKFLKNPSPQKHIALLSLEIVKKFSSGFQTEPYQYEAKLPDDLLHVTSETFLVHAVGGGGQILVLEYKVCLIELAFHHPCC